MKYILILITLIFAFSIQEGLAKSDFREGFIVTMKKDTIYGEIDFRSNAKNYESCLFKKDNIISEYKPVQLLGYGYLNDRYYTSQIKDSTFVETLVEGDLSLYKYDTYYLLRSPAGEILKLEKNTLRIAEDGKAEMKEDARWKGIISYLISDCNTDSQINQNLYFDEKSITKLVTGYNKCKGSEFTVYKVNKPWTKLGLGLTTGLTQSTINSRKLSSLLVYMADSYNSFDPTIGIFFELSAPRVSERFSLQTEVHFSKASFSSLVVLPDWGYTDYHHTYIELSTLSVPLSVKYFLPGNKFSLFFEAGLNYDYNFKKHNTKHIFERVTNNNVYTAESQVEMLFESQTGFLAGMGILKSFNRIKCGATIRYNKSTDLGSYLGVDSTINRLSLSLILCI